MKFYKLATLYKLAIHPTDYDNKFLEKFRHYFVTDPNLIQPIKDLFTTQQGFASPAGYIMDPNQILDKDIYNNLSRDPRISNAVLQLKQHIKGVNLPANMHDKIYTSPNAGSEFIEILRNFVNNNDDYTPEQKKQLLKKLDINTLNDKNLFALNTAIEGHEVGELLAAKNGFKNYKFGPHNDMKILTDEYNYVNKLPEGFERTKDVMNTAREILGEHDLLSQYIPGFNYYKEQGIKIPKSARKRGIQNYNIEYDLLAAYLGLDPNKLPKSVKLTPELLGQIDPEAAKKLYGNYNELSQKIQAGKQEYITSGLSRKQFINHYMQKNNIMPTNPGLEDKIRSYVQIMNKDKNSNLLTPEAKQLTENLLNKAEAEKANQTISNKNNILQQSGKTSNMENVHQANIISNHNIENKNQFSTQKGGQILNLNSNDLNRVVSNSNDLSKVVSNSNDLNTTVTNSHDLNKTVSRTNIYDNIANSSKSVINTGQEVAENAGAVSKFNLKNIVNKIKTFIRR